MMASRNARKKGATDNKDVNDMVRKRTVTDGRRAQDDHRRAEKGANDQRYALVKLINTLIKKSGAVDVAELWK